MKRITHAWQTMALMLLFAAMATAQGTGQLNGQVLNLEGKPYPDVSVEIKNPATGQVYKTNTDTNGKFIQLGLRTAVYTITLKNEKDKLDFTTQFVVKEGEANNLNINFKELAAKEAAAHPEEAKKREEETQKFEGLKAHFDAGVAAMTEAKTLRTQLSSTPADQRAPIQDKLKADYQTAITEFTQAEQATQAQDVANHALVWANLGVAYEGAGRNDDAASAFQKAIELKPQPAYYISAATNLARAGKISEAGPYCAKAGELDPANSAASTATCWRNVGIVLSNAGKMKEAVEPLRKATEVNPKDADAWFLLGGALAGNIDSKQEGDKMIYIIPPGTVEAYKKYLDLAPSGPHAGEAKQMLEALATYSQGETTREGSAKKKKKG
jgi:tetratricopeptide (TPR) repeat protein